MIYRVRFAIFFCSSIQSIIHKKQPPEVASKVCEILLSLCRWRVLGHLAAVLIAAPETSLLHTLRSMMLEIPGEFFTWRSLCGENGWIQKNRGVCLTFMERSMKHSNSYTWIIINVYRLLYKYIYIWKECRNRSWWNHLCQKGHLLSISQFPLWQIWQRCQQAGKPGATSQTA